MGYDYDFFKNLLNSTDDICAGVRGGDFEALYTHGLQGNAPAELLADIDRLMDSGFFILANRAAQGHPVQQAPHWRGNINCIRSVYCHINGADLESGVCCECAALLTDKKLLKFAATTTARAEKHLKQLDDGVLKLEDFRGVSVDNMGTAELRRRVEAGKKAFTTVKSTVFNSKRTLAAATACVSKLKEALKNRETELPQFIDDFIKAYYEGAFEDKEILADLMADIAANLLRKPQGRRHNETAKAFYVSIMNYGGPRLHSLVSEALDGVSLRTCQRERALFYHYELGWGGIVSAITHAASILEKSGYAGVPCLIGEDSTALQIAIQPVFRDDKIYICGFCGGAIEIQNLNDLCTIAEENDYGTALYIYTLIPLVGNGPTIVVGAIVHNNTNETLSTERIRATWDVLQNSCRDVGIRLMGHVSDGDSRLRKCDQELCFGELPNGAISLDHPLIQMFMPKVGGGLVDFVLATQDFLHLLFRLRVQFLNPLKNLMIGPFKIQFRHLMQLVKMLGENYRLPATYLSPKDKQNNSACERLADIGCIKGEKVVLDGGEDERLASLRAALLKIPEFYGTYLFMEFFHRFTRIFVVKRSVEDSLKDVGFCLAFLGRWHQSIVEQLNGPAMANLKKNFITAETYKDCIIALNSLVLLVLYLKKVETETGVKQEWVPGRMSSRHVEYTFGFLRAISSGSIITALSAKESLHIKDCQMHMELLHGIKPTSGRRLPSQEAINTRSNQGISPALPDIEAIKMILDLGQTECETFLKKKVQIDGDEASVFDTLSRASQESMTFPLMPQQKTLVGRPQPFRGGTATVAAALQPNEGDYDADKEYDIDNLAGDDEESEDEDPLSTANPRRLHHVLGDIESRGDGSAADSVERRDIFSLARYFSSVFEKQKKDRAGGRFYGQHLHASIGTLESKGDEEYFSDEDDFAALYQEDPNDPSTAYIEIGRAEGFTVQGKKGGPEVRHEVCVNDPTASISHISWYKPVKIEPATGPKGRSTKGKRKQEASVVAERYKMRILATDINYHKNYKIGMEAVVCPVVLHYDETTNESFLDKDCHRVVTEFLGRYQRGELTAVGVKRARENRRHRQTAKKDERKKRAKKT